MRTLMSIALILLLPVLPAFAGQQGTALEALSPAEKDNTMISIDLDATAAQYTGEARAVAELWNAGRYGPALERFGALEELVKPEAMEVRTRWRTPPAPPAPKWGDDVRLGSPDSAFAVTLVRDTISSNLFAVVARNTGGSNKNQLVYFSDDGGQTWVQTVGLGSAGRYISSAAVMGDYCYYAYVRSSTVRIRRVSRTTGTSADFSNGLEWYDVYSTTADSVKSISLIPWATQLYLGTIHDGGDFRLFWANDTTAVTWQELPSPDSTADDGLDLAGNLPYSQYFVYATYNTKANQVRIMGLALGLNWDTLRTISVNPTGNYTAVGAHRDTVMVAYELTSSGDHRINGYYSYDGGINWVQGLLNYTGTNSYGPDVTLRGGQAVSFMQDSPWDCMVRTRPRAGGSWSTDTVFTAVQPDTNFRTSIEHLGGSVHGVAYISDEIDSNRVYFDRSDWVSGVAGGPDIPVAAKPFVLLAPNPARARAWLSFSLSRPGPVRAALYDIAGRRVRTVLDRACPAGPCRVPLSTSGLAAGVFLLRVVAPGIDVVRKLSVVR